MAEPGGVHLVGSHASAVKKPVAIPGGARAAQCELAQVQLLRTWRTIAPAGEVEPNPTAVPHAGTALTVYERLIPVLVVSAHDIRLAGTIFAEHMPLDAGFCLEPPTGVNAAI